MCVDVVVDFSGIRVKVDFIFHVRFAIKPRSCFE